ncbi:hypothetical protein RDWZM_004890 [Blomia tropicalis]|uniref:Uncharacterized protein n=1 Tax=Blomia tropicalis TaxID=40697 RepID=A0A9Q0M2Z4_BLOTA|nr:hypothetical protein RDWZM_004890 [Blomia tropicalis]
MDSSNLIDVKQSFPKRHLVYSDSCHLIEWPLYDEETGPLIQTKFIRPITCQRPTIEIVRFNYTWIHIPAIRHDSRLRCYANEIFHNHGDDYKLGLEIVSIHNEYTEFPHSNALRIDCYKWMKAYGIKMKQLAKIESTIIPLIPFKKKKKTKRRKKRKRIDKMPNVLMLGIDSISWLNFRRYFKRTETFLSSNGFIPLYGFTKVGDNTFPNMMATLTGKHYTNYWNASIDYDMRFDSIPIVWKRFSKLGYLTSLIEDMPAYSLFNYGRNGFQHSPVDYYLRPVSVMIDNDLNNGYCYKDKLTMEYYYSWILDHSTAMRDRMQPFFTFSHMADLTHNLYWNAANADRPLFHLLRSLFERQIHRNTLIIVFSDHGIRFGKLRNTKSGHIEERLPFIYVYVPEHFNLNVNESKMALGINRHRLTCHFDLHATLRHIVEPNEPIDDEPYGRSLLRPIPFNRTCESAGISENWCLCYRYDRYDGDQQTRSTLSQFVLSQINHLLRDEKRCAQLKLKRLEQILIRTDPPSSQIDGTQMFRLQIRLRPGGGLFDATVRMNASSSISKFKLMGIISRLDKYGNQSKCIHNSILEKYCFCIK